MTQQTTQVTQYTRMGVPIKSFKSMSEASRMTGINAGGIHKAVRGDNNTAGGFIWKETIRTKEKYFTETVGITLRVKNGLTKLFKDWREAKNYADKKGSYPYPVYEDIKKQRVHSKWGVPA